MTQALEQQTHTVEEYLNLELKSETRSEYRNGEIIPMTGGTPDHNDIAGNLILQLRCRSAHLSFKSKSPISTKPLILQLPDA